jgi:hypothetical protein
MLIAGQLKQLEQQQLLLESFLTFQLLSCRPQASF